MKATKQLHNLGQSIWPDNISEAATSFVKSWNDLLNVISSKAAALQQAA